MISGQQTNDQIEEIVEKARIKNAKLGITGILLTVDDCFMQVLEGDKDTVMELY